MKNTILKSILVITFLVVLGTSVQAKAPVFFGWGGEQIIKVADLPDTDEFEHRRGTYIDAGYVYKQVHVFFIPVWNYDERWVGYVGKDDTYLEIDKAELDKLAQSANVKLPDSPSLSFWHSFGGKMVFGLILLLYFGWRFLSSSTDNDEEEPLSVTA